MDDHHCCHQSGGGFLKGIILGSLIGAGIVALMTPNTGEENRKLLKKKGKEWEKAGRKLISNAAQEIEDSKDELSQKIQDVSDTIEEKAESISSFLDNDELQDAVDNTKKAIENTRKALGDVWEKKVEPAFEKAKEEVEDIEESEVELARKILSRAAGKSFYRKAKK